MTWRRRLEGLPRHTSMHAAGVVISQKSVDEYVPLSRAGRRYHHHPVYHDDPGRAGASENGFSGSADSDGDSKCGDVWRKKVPGKPLILTRLIMTIKQVLDSIGTGKTDGVFQLESSGDEKLHEGAEATEPGGCHCRNFPVPARSHGFYSPVYQRKKQSGKRSHYDCPQLEPILDATYGCIVYQEQVMQIVRNLGGLYPWKK